jgi:apolipoprotein N-acyltransferase
MAFAPKQRNLINAAAATAATAVLVWFGTGLDPLWPLLWFAPLLVLLYAGRARWWRADSTFKCNTLHDVGVALEG